MIYLDDTVLAKQLLVFLQQQVQNLRVGIGIPAAIASCCLHFHACHRETALQGLHDIVLHILATRAGQDLDTGLATFDVDDSQVA